MNPPRLRGRRFFRTLTGAGLAGLTILAVRPAQALPQVDFTNGNELALLLSETTTAKERTDLIRRARGQVLYFRYLQTTLLEEGVGPRGEYIRLETTEPSSYLTVRFVVKKRVSLALLREDPPVEIGDAVAIRGRIKDIDPDGRWIEVDPVVVRHRDRPTPTRRMELLSDLDPNANVYTYTGGSRPVHVTHRDRDLLEHKQEILEKGGPEAWIEFLENAIAERNRKRHEKKQAP